MEDKDIELCLCSNDPIFVSGIPIYPISLKEIARIGYTKFNVGMRFLCLTSDDIKLSTGNDIPSDEVFKYILSCCLAERELMEITTMLLSKITRSNIRLSLNRQAFSCGAFEINRKNFCVVQEVIRLRNGQCNLQEEEENPDNEAARRVLLRRKEERLKRRKAKASENETDITLSDLISIMANCLGMTMDEVMQYDLYQFNDQFNRLKIMDNYEVSVQALLHGAKKEDVNLIHWITKIKRDEE